MDYIFYQRLLLFRGDSPEEIKIILDCLGCEQKRLKEVKPSTAPVTLFSLSASCCQAGCRLKMMICGEIKVFWTALGQARYLQRRMPVSRVNR